MMKLDDHVSNSTQSRRYQKSQSRQSAKLDGPGIKTGRSKQDGFKD